MTILKLCFFIFITCGLGLIASVINLIVNKKSTNAKYYVIGFSIAIVVLLIIGIVGIVDALSNCGGIGVH